LVLAELDYAETAVHYIQQWLKGEVTEPLTKPLSIKQAAKRLEVSTDRLRDWERNGLLTAQRNPKNNYREYGAEEIGRLRVICALRRARFSTLSILRMLLAVEKDNSTDVRQALDTPDPEDDIQYATNQWLSTLTIHEQRAIVMIEMLEEMVKKHGNQYPVNDDQSFTDYC